VSIFGAEGRTVDERQLRALDARFRRPLMTYFLRRVGDRCEAEDLTQQVFMRLLGVYTELEQDRAHHYVFTVAANLLKDRGRQAMSQRHAAPNGMLVKEIIAEVMEDRSPERVLLGKEALSDVLATLDELGEKTRDIFVLFRLENMRHREIADLLGMGVSTVEKHVMKATHHLAAKYGGTA
jgi:RNA polymerase sigma factor (sigma-70 family)